MKTLKAFQHKTPDDAKRHYHAAVDQAAEKARLRHLTPGAGQSMAYDLKYQQALAGGGAIIEAEAEALDVTTDEVIASVLNARQQCEAAITYIEAARLKAKKGIREAQKAAEMSRIASELKNQLAF